MRSRNERCQSVNLHSPLFSRRRWIKPNGRQGKKEACSAFFILSTIRSLCSEAPTSSIDNFYGRPGHRVASTWIGSSVFFWEQIFSCFRQKKKKENFKFTPFLVKFTPFLRASDYMQIKFECVWPTPLMSRWKVINKFLNFKFTPFLVKFTLKFNLHIIRRAKKGCEFNQKRCEFKSFQKKSGKFWWNVFF